jgi:hypothetical protein
MWVVFNILILKLLIIIIIQGKFIDNNAQKLTVNGGHVTTDYIKRIFSFSFQIKFLVLQNHSCVYKF